MDKPLRSTERYGLCRWATWLVNYNTSTGWGNFADSLEAGIYSGIGTNISWTTYVLPYDTYSNGLGEHDVNQPLTGGAGVWIAVAICNGCGGSIMQVGSYVEAIHSGTYQVQTPRWNYSQAEVGGVPPQSTQMCGGYDQLAMYYGAASGGWYHWGFEAVSADGPYTEATLPPYTWYCGGS